MNRDEIVKEAKRVKWMDRELQKVKLEAEARGMKKAAEEIFQQCQALIENPEMFKEQTFFGTVHVSIMDLIARYLLEANKTLEAE